MTLTQTDITILIEALDAWVEKDNAGDLMIDLLTASLCQDPRIREGVEADKKRFLGERKLEKGRRAEVAVLLQATLIRMRRELDSRDGWGTEECPSPARGTLV